MTALDRPASQVDSRRTSRARSPRGAELRALAAVAATVAMLAQLPLLANHIFYYWDDSASEYLPHFHEIGRQLLAGHWPVLDPSMWMGGNNAAWMMMGLFNPVSLANCLLVAALPDLNIAAVLVKTQFLVLLAVGVYLLAREYGAERRAAAVVATALPFTGYTLYFDAAAWSVGLMAFAWLPLVWWSARRFALGRLNPLVPVLLGFLAMSTGNPYGALGAVVVLLAVLVEVLLTRGWRRCGPFVLVGAVIGLSAVVVYLPLLGSSSVTWRANLGVANDGFMVPGLGDLAAMSAPTYLPRYPLFGSAGGHPISVPAMYLGWFLVPLLPWLRFSTLRQRIRERAALLVFGGIFLAFLVGPSTVWLFRWPARLTEYVALPIGIGFAIVLSAGLRTTQIPGRLAASAGLVLLGGYLSWASAPDLIGQHLGAAALVLLLIGAIACLVQRSPRAVTSVLVLGTALTLGWQVWLYPGNANLAALHYPHNVARMRAAYADYHGNTLQIGEEHALAQLAPLTPDGAWRDMILGNAAHAAGVHALNAYTGVGYVAFDDALCMNFHGGTCADAFRRLWQPAPGTTGMLADALRLETVVMLNGYRDTGPVAGGEFEDPHAGSTVDPDTPPVAAPAGWTVAKRTALVTVLRRNNPLAWPAGRLSWADSGVRVSADAASSGADERLRYSGQGSVVFAELAWPGLRASVDGKPVPVRQGPAGLVAIDLPSAAAGGSTLTLSFTPPGFRLGIPLLALSLGLGLAYGVRWELRRRRAAQATEVGVPPVTDTS